MSERKVLNKYYPPDFDPAKIPRLRLPKDRQYTVRLMAPCNMRCTTCGEYIYKGKKFNARKETVQNEEYLGIKIFRFYIKCPRCLAEITFKTDPQNADYVVENGATRNFQALKLAEEQAEREAKEIEEEEKSNPMKLLENRTKASKREMELLESLEELRDLNQRHAQVDFDHMLKQYAIYEENLKIKQEEEDEAFIREVFGKSDDKTLKESTEEIIEEVEEDHEKPVTKSLKRKNPTDILSEEKLSSGSNNKQNTWGEGTTSVKPTKSLKNLVKLKKSVTNNTTTTTSTAAATTKTEEVQPIIQQPSNSLNMLGVYSDTDSDG